MIKTKTVEKIREYDTCGNLKKKTKIKTVTTDDADYRDREDMEKRELPFA